MAIYSRAAFLFKDINLLIEHFISILIGSLFIFSGLGKLLNVNELIIGTIRYGFPFQVAVLTIFLPTIEILLGFLFYFHKTRKIAGIMGILSLTCFSIIYLYGYFIRNISDCGCFGVISFMDDSPSFILIRNFILGIGTIWLIKRNFYKPQSLYSWQRVFIFIICIIAATASGASSIRPLYEKVHPWIGKPIQDTPLAQLISTSRNSTYLLFFYGMNCQSCWQLIEQIKGFQQQAIVDSVIGFTVGTDSSLSKFVQMTQVNFPNILINGKDIRNFVNFLPTTFYIRRDTIYYVAKDDLLSPLSFKTKILKSNKTYF